MQAAVLGYGRFGASLCGLIQAAGMQVRALDPVAEVPDTLRADSPEALVNNVDLVFLAVPVHETTNALHLLRPHLNSAHLILDVASVKYGPTQAMKEVLAEEIPWVATHPLFGPSSIALEERPYRVVVCPNQAHPTAAGRAREFYQKIGCEVLEQDAEEHDRMMARTHALAFFIAKAMIDIKAAEGLHFTPPSFQAMVRTIDSVRSDAGHLFYAIEKENPYAEESRAALLAALEKVHQDLLEAEIQSDAFAIPSLGKLAPELRETRDLIDDIDKELVQLLLRRTQLARKAGKIKAGEGKAIRDPKREKDLLAAREEWARDSGLDPAVVTEVFQSILRSSRMAQRKDQE